MSCPSMAGMLPKPIDKGIPKGRLSVFLDEVATWGDYGASILNHMHGRITLFYKQELDELKGKDYNDFIMKQVAVSEELPKYIEAMKEVTNRYRLIADLWENMESEERLEYIKYALRRILDVESSVEGDGDSAKDYTS